MKVYVMTTHIVDEDDDLGINNRIFANRQDAIDALKEWREQEVNVANAQHNIIAVNIDTYFESYADGYYSATHAVGRVREEEIE